MVTPMTSLLKVSVGFARQQQPEGSPLLGGAVKWHLAFQPQTLSVNSSPNSHRSPRTICIFPSMTNVISEDNKIGRSEMYVA